MKSLTLVKKDERTYEFTPNSLNDKYTIFTFNPNNVYISSTITNVNKEFVWHLTESLYNSGWIRQPGT